MALGLCCHYLDGDNKNLIVSKSLQKGRYEKGFYDKDKIKNTYLSNIINLKSGLKFVVKENISVFRMSSSMFPLWDLVDPHTWDNYHVNVLLDEIGKYVAHNSIRLTTHPAQFFSLTSDSTATVNTALKEVEFQSYIMDKMGLSATPYNAINLHGGKSNQTKRLIENINKLSDKARSRLTLENCEYSYSVNDLHEVYVETGVPICFDSHHHVFNDGGLSISDALDMAMSTWKVKPLCHLSNSKEGVTSDANTRQRRQHSDFIRFIPQSMREKNNLGMIDIDVEAKKKNHAIKKMVETLDISI